LLLLHYDDFKIYSWRDYEYQLHALCIYFQNVNNLHDSMLPNLDLIYAYI